MCNNFVFLWNDSIIIVNYRGYCKLDNVNFSFVFNLFCGELRFYFFIILYFLRILYRLNFKLEYRMRYVLEWKLSVLNYILIFL